MRRLAFAIALVTALAAAVLLALNWPRAEASPDVTITVDSIADTNIRDTKLTLREAMMLATGGLSLGALFQGECNQVSGAAWKSPFGPCEAKHSPGEASADTIIFHPTTFSPGTIELSDTLPPLDTGNDTVDGSAAGVIVEGGGATSADFDCVEITSDDNTIKGLEIYNCNNGVIISDGAQNNTVGGSTEAERNVISGNRIGVVISDDGTNHNTIKGNYIGTNAAGDAAIGDRYGVSIWQGPQSNTIGGSTTPGQCTGDCNVISGNSSAGVSIHGVGTDGNVVTGNYIGTNADGDAAIGNDYAGVAIGSFAQNNTVGGSTEAERNVISGNSWVGVELGNGGQGNTVTGNFIGTSADGDAAVPNEVGVHIWNRCPNNTVGGAADGEGNLIAYNVEDGVRVQNSDTYGNTIRGNSIHSNGGKGISLVDGGNTELEPPAIDSAGSVYGTACSNCTIDIYSDDEGEGRVYEGSTTADGDGNWSLFGTPEGPNITATATDSDGNTSEFSAPLEPPWPTPSPTPTATPTPGATRTLAWGPGWHNATWSGTSTPEEAFACAAGNYAAAYRLVSGGWERHFPDRPDLSNMADLAQYDAFLILITEEVTCDMPVADPPGTERTLDWGVGWQNEGWTGADDTPPQDAFACADGSYAAAYRLVGGGWERHFPGRPDVSNMEPLSKYDPFLILVTAPVSCTMAIAP